MTGLLLVTLALVSVVRAAEVVDLAGGRYRMVAPDSWDKRTPLPMVLWLHGWQQDSSMVLTDKPLVDAVTQTPALMVIPDGLDKTWTYTGSPSQARNDVAFLHAVVDDAERRWPVDRTKVIGAGFSQGASMLWELACHSASGFRAFLPFSGGFWEPFPARCESGAISMRHVHGTQDGMVPLEGRRLGFLYKQGDVPHGLELLRAAGQCPAVPPILADAEHNLSCSMWRGCGDGHEIELCLHPGGHAVNEAWIRGGIAWALAQPETAR